jgi:hypothetical protein
MHIELHDLLEGLKSSGEDFNYITDIPIYITAVSFTVCGFLIGISVITMILQHC